MFIGLFLINSVNIKRISFQIHSSHINITVFKWLATRKKTELASLNQINVKIYSTFNKQQHHIFNAVCRSLRPYMQQTEESRLGGPLNINEQRISGRFLTIKTQMAMQRRQRCTASQSRVCLSLCVRTRSSSTTRARVTESKQKKKACGYKIRPCV